ncbi:Holliday junction resolvase YqgF [Candidatus Saccharibacteria bacterium RAAC3_TM7_1]|nr:Holliday junction resolvase YqgF [Candidatus Saccharibacteria bacterium RAAC3_TM7_1]
MTHTKAYLGLDVGTVRIGVALADDIVRIAIPYGTLDVDGNELREIARLVIDNNISHIVVGYPRNQAGEPTAQSRLVEAFSENLKDMAPHLEFQDESLTSVLAEDRLKKRGGAYTKGDIDAEAATIILQDYLEQRV